jgi:endonuclease G, mitochondrial
MLQQREEPNDTAPHEKAAREEGLMEINVRVMEGAARRWQERSKVREPHRVALQAGRLMEVETPERIQKRLERLAMTATEERAARANASRSGISQPSTPPTPSRLVETIGLERVMGKADFLGINFLELALAVSRFVGRIHLRSRPDRSAGFGTGCMVSPRLLLTNNHVLGSPQEALYSEVEFDYQYDRSGRLLPVRVYGLEPQTFFLTSPELDYTLVAVRELSLDGIGLERYGWSRLIGAQGKALLGDALNIIQHPQGEAKQIVLRSNQLIDLFDQFAHYVTDTEPGSSGSPVYNDQWEVVALHHSGVPKMENGHYVAKDGSVWRPGMDPEDLEWVANEGIRVSSLVDHIKAQPLPVEQQRLRDELLNREPPHPFEAARIADHRLSDDGQEVPRTDSGMIHADTNAYTLTIPLQISVRLGVPTLTDVPRRLSPMDSGTTAAPADSPPLLAPVSSGPLPADPALREALTELAAATTREYYNEREDLQARQTYYQDLSDHLEPAELYARLSELLKRTHTNRLKYQPSTHVYPWVDLHEARPTPKLKSIYSGRDFDPREFIEEDFRIEQERARLRALLTREASFSAIGAQEQLDLLEASLPYNCEHVVPQSWFAKREPMRGDLHHLFACESGCNSFRGNIPYYDFADFEEAVREACGKREENKFEPSFGKGAVARATLYFLLRYPKEINKTHKEYTPDRLQTLVSWHEHYPPTRYEQHRNMAIFAKQGNRNPLIDYPAWANQIDFSRGLG